MFASIAAAALAAANPATVAEHQAACAGKDGWSDPAPPVQVYTHVLPTGILVHKGPPSSSWTVTIHR